MSSTSAATSSAYLQGFPTCFTSDFMDRRRHSILSFRNVKHYPQTSGESAVQKDTVPLVNQQSTSANKLQEAVYQFFSESRRNGDLNTINFPMSSNDESTASFNGIGNEEVEMVNNQNLGELVLTTGTQISSLSKQRAGSNLAYSANHSTAMSYELSSYPCINEDDLIFEKDFSLHSEISRIQSSKTSQTAPQNSSSQSEIQNYGKGLNTNLGFERIDSVSNILLNQNQSLNQIFGNYGSGSEKVHNEYVCKRTTDKYQEQETKKQSSKLGQYSFLGKRATRYFENQDLSLQRHYSSQEGVLVSQSTAQNNTQEMIIDVDELVVSSLNNSCYGGVPNKYNDRPLTCLEDDYQPFTNEDSLSSTKSKASTNISAPQLQTGDISKFPCQIVKDAKNQDTKQPHQNSCRAYIIQDNFYKEGESQLVAGIQYLSENSSAEHMLKVEAKILERTSPLNGSTEDDSGQSFHIKQESADLELYQVQKRLKLDNDNESHRNFIASSSNEQSSCSIDQSADIDGSASNQGKPKVSLASFKKNKDQTIILDQEFESNPIWSKAKMRELADRLGLKESSIYKWHWDRTQTVNKRFQKTLRKINTAVAKNQTVSKSSKKALPKIIQESKPAVSETQNMTQVKLETNAASNENLRPNIAEEQTSLDNKSQKRNQVISTKIAPCLIFKVHKNAPRTNLQ